MECIIKTKRLLLRPFTLADAEDLFELDSNPKVHQYLGNNPITSIDETKEVISSVLNQYSTFGIGRLGIVISATQEFIGWAGLKYEQQLRKDFSYFDLGYRIKEPYWGQGYASEAALASLNYGFKVLKLKEICAAAHEDNLASNHILKKIGLKTSGQFIYEGTKCNWYCLKNPCL